jgi:hypothetical protein
MLLSFQKRIRKKLEKFCLRQMTEIGLGKHNFQAFESIFSEVDP